MHHLAADKTAPNLATNAHSCADAERLLMRGIKMNEPENAGVAAVVNRHTQLSARAKCNFAVGHHALDLHQVTIARVPQHDDAGFVLVTQRQMQGQINIAAQTELVQRFLGLRFLWRWRLGAEGFTAGFTGLCSGWRHGTIVPP